MMQECTATCPLYLDLKQKHISNTFEPDRQVLAALQRYFGSNAEQGGPGRAVGSQVEQANGVTRMMQQCTAMLRDRMGEEACTPLQTNPLR